MNNIVKLCLALTLTMMFSSILYFTPYFSKKKIRKGKFDLLQFINLFFIPALLIPVIYFLRRIILSNPEMEILPVPKFAYEISMLFLLYFLILGNGIHSVSVVIQKHMKNLKHQRVWEVNEFFHNAFSHILMMASGSLILVLFVVTEINYPLSFALLDYEIIILVTSGIISGIIFGMATIEGSIGKLMFYLLYALSLFIPFTFVFYNLDFRHFPFSTFVETVFIISVVTISTYKYKRKGFPEIVPHHFFDD